MGQISNGAKSVLKEQPKSEYRVLMFGLDLAGKSTLLERWNTGELLPDLPQTQGFNIRSLSNDTSIVTVWDFGGKNAFPHRWAQYYPGNHGLIFVLDGSELCRLKEAKEMLKSLLCHEFFKDSPLLVVVNKLDRMAIEINDIGQQIGVEDFGHRKYYIQYTSCVTGEGLESALLWLRLAISQRKSKRS